MDDDEPEPGKENMRSRRRDVEASSASVASKK